MDVSERREPVLAVEAVGLTKRYPLTWKHKVLVALDHLNLKIKPGEVFGLLGPNGSGKSTTMKLLLGLIRPSSGEARVFGEPPGTLAALKRVGFLPENPYFYSFLDGDETLRFYGKLTGMSGAKLEARINELIAMVGLENGRERPLRSYSKGMLQRIGLAQAMMHDPDLLFLDEPTAGVDPLGSAQIRDLILQLKKMGKTVIFSSHLLEQVEEVSDRVAIFSLGKKVLEGSLHELLTENEGVEVHLPDLSPEQQERVRGALQAAGVDPATARFTRPRITLEQLYLRTVQGGIGSLTEEAGKKMSGSLYRILIIGRNTLLESVRQRVLSVLLIFAVVLVGASVWFSGVATPGLDQAGLFDAQIKFVKDAGCGCIEVFGGAIALLSVAQLLPQELHNRTIYTIPAKPVRRSEFLLGKFLGVVLLLVLCVALMSLAFAALLAVQEWIGLSYVKEQYAQSPDWRKSAYLVGLYNHDAALVINQVRDPQLIQAILLIFAKLVMASAIAMLVSTFATSSIFTIVTTFMIYLIGYMEGAAREVWLAAASSGHPSLVANTLAAAIAVLIPDLNAYSIVDEILSGHYVPWSHTLDLVAYAGAYLVVLLSVSVVIFEYREI